MYSKKKAQRSRYQSHTSPGGGGQGICFLTDEQRLEGPSQRQDAPGRPYHGCWGRPAWSWPHPSCARAKDPRRGALTLLSSLHFLNPRAGHPTWDVPQAPQIPQHLKLNPSLPTSPHTGGHTIFWGTAWEQQCPRTAPSALCPPTAAMPLPRTHHPSPQLLPPVPTSLLDQCSQPLFGLPNNPHPSTGGCTSWLLHLCLTSPPVPHANSPLVSGRLGHNQVCAASLTCTASRTFPTWRHTQGAPEQRC